MTTQTFILAAGDHIRWRGSKPKQLCEFDGVPLIVHTVEQVTALGLFPVVVTHRQEIADAVFGRSCHVFVPECRSCVLDTLVSTQELWQEQNTALLGDVVFSDTAIAHICQYLGKPMFFGSEEEIFAFSFPRQSSHNLRHAVERVVVQMGIGEYGAKFWYLHQQLCGQRPNAMQRRVCGHNYTLILDDTDDIDRPEDYERMLKEREQ